MHPILSLFEPMLDFKSRDELVSYLKRHPVLTSPYYTELLNRWADTLAGARQQAARDAIALKLDVWKRMSRQEIRVEVSNPILELAKSVVDGRMTSAHAQVRAAKADFFVELMYPMVCEVCDLAEEIVLKNWRPAVTMMKITLAALDARQAQIPENQQDMEATAAESWLAVVRFACSDVPDGRIFHDAVRRGEAVADHERNSDPPGNISHRLGTLHLDPYVSGRSSANFDMQYRAWQTRLEEEYGNELAGLAEEEMRLPPIEVALPKAVGYFRRAAALRSGIARGRTLKAMAQSLDWQDQVFHLPVDHRELAAIAVEAMSLLPADQFPAEHAELGAILKKLGETPSAQADDRKAQAEQLLAIPVHEHVARINKQTGKFGEINTIDIFLQHAQAMLESDPRLALRLRLAVYDLVHAQPEAQRSNYDRDTLVYLRRGLAPEGPSADGTPLRPMIQSLRRTAKEQRWPPEKLACALLWLAASTTATNQEAEGLETLAASEESAAEPGGLLHRLKSQMRVVLSQDGGVPSRQVFRQLAIYVRAMLETGSAVNFYDTGDYASASMHYCAALQANLDCDQTGAALDIVRRLLDLAKPGRSASLERLIAALATHALTLEREARNAATDLIQFACRHASSLLMESGHPKATVLLIVFDVAKGRRFRAALEGGGVRQWQARSMMLELETEIRALRKKAALEPPAAAPIFDENTLLTAYVRPEEAQGGTTATEQLRNLQIRFDSLLDRQLTAATDKEPWVPTLETVQSALADDEVLVVQYVGAMLAGACALTTLLITQEDCIGVNGIIPVPSATIVMRDEEQGVTLNWLSLGVADLRNRVCSPPGPLVADSRALETLDEDVSMFFGGGFWERLADLHAAGKRHLRFCPHGPLHYYPFHLIGPEDHPLTQDWCVTYLPNLRLVTRKSRPLSPDKIPLTSIGLNFDVDNPHGLGELTGPEAEAAAIAAGYGPDARLIIGSDATERAVTDALIRSHRIHISTHGRHNVSAPSFQHIYLHPTAYDDGVIHAYELLGLDLSGLDLVTLSACETALGRFDTADNLRGIPAALLIAGVATIVGTLWKVDDPVSTLFFKTFYNTLKASESKRRAFVEAQRQTRASFSAYRDWGAFQLIGVS